MTTNFSRREKSANELLLIEGVKLLDFYNTLILPLAKTTGRNFRPMTEKDNTGLCPFHEDKDPSFHDWRKTKIFHCFGCSHTGDIVETYLRLQRQYFGEKIKVEKAVEQLASIFEIELLPPEEGFVVQSVFERARALASDRSIYRIPKGQLSLGEFRSNNNRVRLSNYPINVKVENFEQLDLIVSLHLSNQK